MTYTLLNEDLNQLSTFGKQVYNVVQNSLIVYCVGNNKYIKHTQVMRTYSWWGNWKVQESTIYDSFKYYPNDALSNAISIFNKNKNSIIK